MSKQTENVSVFLCCKSPRAGTQEVTELLSTWWAPENCVLALLSPGEPPIPHSPGNKHSCFKQLNRASQYPAHLLTITEWYI